MKRYALVLLLLASSAYADPELIRSRTCLVFPWSMEGDDVSYTQVSNQSTQNLAVHWTYWSSSCDALADVSTCLTPGGSIVMDSSAVQNSVWVDGENQRRGNPVNLRAAADARGLDPSGTLYVAASEAEPGAFLDCLSTGVLASQAILGRWTIADTAVHVSAGGNAQGFGLSEDGSRCELPDTTLDSLTFQTFAPSALTESTIIIYAAEEGGGGGGELGPACRRQGAFARPCLVQVPTSFTDSDEIRTSLGDLLFGCSTRIDLTQGVTAGFTSGGAFTLDQPIVVPTDLQLASLPVGGTRWAGGFSSEGVGVYGAAASAWIQEGPPAPTPSACPPERQIVDPVTGQILCLPAPTPTPAPSPTPTPTPVSCPPGSTPIFDPTTGELIGCIAPSPSPTPTPTATPEVTPTP